jgi:hypothetical protein
MRRSTVLFPVLLLIAGCGDSTMYYQTRYIPSSDESFTTIGRLGYSADDDVYELPAQPPTLDGEHRKRADCAVPGQKFKPQAKVAYAPQEVRSNGPSDGPVVAVEDARMHPVGPDKGLKDVPVAKIENQPFEGLNQTRHEIITPGITDYRPHSTTGAGTDRNPTIPVEASKDGNPYCCNDVAREPVVDANGNLIRLAKP